FGVPFELFSQIPEASARRGFEATVEFLLHTIGKDRDHKVPTKLGMGRFAEEFAPDGQQRRSPQCRQISNFFTQVVLHSPFSFCMDIAAPLSQQVKRNQISEEAPMKKPPD